MWGLEETKALNEAQAVKELAQLREYTLRGLRFAFGCGGIAGVLRLLTEALGEATVEVEADQGEHTRHNCRTIDCQKPGHKETKV